MNQEERTSGYSFHIQKVRSCYEVPNLQSPAARESQTTNKEKRGMEVFNVSGKKEHLKLKIYPTEKEEGTPQQGVTGAICRH